MNTCNTCEDGASAADTLKTAFAEFNMPGGQGTSAPVAMKKSNPVNMNPDIKAPDMSPDQCGIGRGPNGAC